MRQILLSVLLFFFSLQLSANFCNGLGYTYVNSNKEQQLLFFTHYNDKYSITQCFHNNYDGAKAECEIIRLTSGPELCAYENRVDKFSKIFTRILETGVSVLTDGGISQLSDMQKAQYVKNVVTGVRNDLRANNKCFAKSIIDNLMNGNDITAQLETYYRAYLEAAPFIGRGIANTIADRTTYDTQERIVADHIVRIFNKQRFFY